MSESRCEHRNCAGGIWWCLDCHVGEPDEVRALRVERDEAIAHLGAVLPAAGWLVNFKEQHKAAEAFLERVQREAKA